MTDKPGLSTAQWKRAHSVPHVKTKGALHDAEKAKAIRALDPPAGVVLTGAALAGTETDQAEDMNAAARKALDEFGSQSKEFADVFFNAPASALAVLTQDARTTAGFEPQQEPPSTSEFNAFTSAIGTNPLLFVTTAIQLHGNTAIYTTEEAAAEGTLDLLPFAMPGQQQKELEALFADVAEQARQDGTTPEHPLAIYLFRITASDKLSFSLTGSNWTVSATFKRPPFGTEKKLEIRVELQNGLNAVLKWKPDQWKVEVAEIAKHTDVIPTFKEWITGFSTPFTETQ